MLQACRKWANFTPKLWSMEAKTTVIWISIQCQVRNSLACIYYSQLPCKSFERSHSKLLQESGFVPEKTSAFGWRRDQGSPEEIHARCRSGCDQWGEGHNNIIDISTFPLYAPYPTKQVLFSSDFNTEWRGKPSTPRPGREQELNFLLGEAFRGIQMSYLYPFFKVSRHITAIPFVLSYIHTCDVYIYNSFIYSTHI